MLNLEQQLLQRLAAGEQVAMPVLLQEAPESKLQQMPEGLGSQVSVIEHTCTHASILSLA